MPSRPKILFLCTGNACRSQMAEGFARALVGGRVEPFSAGVAPGVLDPRAVRVMAESAVDISGQRPKGLSDLPAIAFDHVVTLCDAAQAQCAVFPGAARVVHVGFDDPPRLAAGARSEDEALGHYRRVRDQIRAFVEGLPESLSGDKSEDAVRETVREGYARVARGDTGGGCCGSAKAEDVARAVGYSEAELAGLPDGANLGLSCGNPTALAALRPGEVVLDLGSGAGFDGFIAGPRVGGAGRVIGVDMTPEMLVRARANLQAYRQRTGLSNVEFRLGEIENLPVADRAVDVVLSNCVLNLSPDKPRVWREIARVLRPGGRVAVSDLALLRPLPAEVRSRVDALVGCVAGAVTIEETERMMRAAGLAEIRIEPRPGYAETMAEWDDPLYRSIAADLPPGTGPADFVTSVEISARKPAAPGILDKIADTATAVDRT